ncbi:MAG: 1-acyl-sn-glycerol-3-phosphate acyltransferase [Chloroflexota bacterium]|nr:1-acyl-sn-glycerol-3-phosphate acyltransferase [Chloroflexota bacterium]
MAFSGTPPLRWARQIRFRQSPVLDHARLRWYRHESTTYRVVARIVVPVFLKLFARVSVEGLHHVPLSGPVILAANHRDNLDPYLLLHLLPRLVHTAARPDAFGTSGLCGIWRRLGAFPADGWGMRYALSLLADGRAVAVFPQAMISAELRNASGAVGLLALHSGAPVVPIAIVGTQSVHMRWPFAWRARVGVRFGQPVVFSRGPGAPRSLAVADEILRQIGALLAVGEP